MKTSGIIKIKVVNVVSKEERNKILKHFDEKITRKSWYLILISISTQNTKKKNINKKDVTI